MSTTTFEPAPDRTIAPNGLVAIEPAGKRVRVSFNGQQIVDTTGAITLLEDSHTPVTYLPLADIDPAVLEPSDTHTYCPRKGTANYFSIVVGDKTSTDAIWTYPENLPDALDISAYVAFYPDRIDSWDETDA
jgi:uncharacterized protein (DUF427 family)